MNYYDAKEVSEKTGLTMHQTYYYLGKRNTPVEKVGCHYFGTDDTVAWLRKIAEKLNNRKAKAEGGE